jgi:hypothetical protein
VASLPGRRRCGRRQLMIRRGNRGGRLSAHLLLCRSDFVQSGISRGKNIVLACREQPASETRTNSKFITAANCPVPQPEKQMLRLESVPRRRCREIGSATALQLRTIEPSKWSQTRSPIRKGRGVASPAPCSSPPTRYWKVSRAPANRPARILSIQLLTTYARWRRIQPNTLAWFCRDRFPPGRSRQILHL